MQKRYEARLLEICIRICKREVAGRFLYLEIVSSYKRTPRFYHSLKHINGCLDEFTDVRSLLRNPDAVEMAILLHDAVYDVRAKDNEERSAELAKETIKRLSLPDAFGEEVAKLILATKHDVPPADFEAQFMVDIDLASLGCPEKIFDRNRMKVRQEYTHLSDEDFFRGNSAFLRSLLKRPSIYLTLHFHDKYEAQARKNIARVTA